MMEPGNNDKTPCPRGPRWQRRPEDRPDEILAAALAVFSEQGFARARLDDVAQRAGVSKGTLYCYFPSKEELFRATIRHHIVSRLAAFQTKVDAGQATPTDLIRTMIAATWHTLMDDRMLEISRVMHRELEHFPELARFYFDEVILAARHALDGIIKRGVERGEFRAVKHRFASRGIQLLVVHAAHAQSAFNALDPEPLSDEAVVEGISDLILNGLAAGGRAATS
jgi:AcrR family transcriptional regulator